jgi:hypothetical protein
VLIPREPNERALVVVKLYQDENMTILISSLTLVTSIRVGETSSQSHLQEMAHSGSSNELLMNAPGQASKDDWGFGAASITFNVTELRFIQTGGGDYAERDVNKPDSNP